MGTDLTPDTIDSLAGEYLDYYQVHEDAYHKLKTAQQVIKNCSDQMMHIEGELLKTVQPQCGSAHLPSMRIFQKPGGIKGLVVEWDYRSSRGNLSVVPIKGV